MFNSSLCNSLKHPAPMTSTVLPLESFYPACLALMVLYRERKHGNIASLLSVVFHGCPKSRHVTYVPFVPEEGVNRRSTNTVSWKKNQADNTGSFRISRKQKVFSPCPDSPQWVRSQGENKKTTTTLNGSRVAPSSPNSLLGCRGLRQVTQVACSV